MQAYFNIPVWELRQRRDFLLQFHDDVVSYFNSTKIDPTFGKRHETDASAQPRSKINLTMHRARNTIFAAGVNTQITYQPPPVVGGPIHNVDIILNIFNLSHFSISEEMATGLIEQAIGVYSDEESRAKWRTFNPFWWFGKFLNWFAHLPFLLIGKAGFDAKKAEGSVIGKLISLIFYLIPIVGSLLTIFERLGFMDEFRSLLGIS